MAESTQKRPTPRSATPRSQGAAQQARIPRGVRSSAKVAGTKPSREGVFSRMRDRRAQRKAAKAASNAAPSSKVPFSATDPAVRRAQRQGGEQRASRKLKLPSLRAVAITVASLVLVALAATIALLILARTSLFTIESVIATPSEHVSEESLTRLASPESGATLLNLDTDALTENVMRNPWVAEVHITRSFPSTLRISVTERRVRALVVMGTGEVAWCLGDGGVWIEPIQVSAEEGEDFADAALVKAQEMGAVLIRDIPSTVSPEAADTVEDEAILAVLAYIEGFSDEFGGNVVSYSASSAASVGCTLSSGITVSLGEATDIAAKEAIVARLLEEHPGQITYINVRIPANPSYRTIDSPSVQEGTGALGSSGVDPNAAQESEERAAAGMPEDGGGRISTVTSSDDEDDWYDEDEDWY